MQSVRPAEKRAVEMGSSLANGGGVGGGSGVGVGSGGGVGGGGGGGIIPQMLTVENNGEISASVEETNRVRALLGLKPLRGVEALPKHADTHPLAPRLGTVAGPMLPPVGVGPASSSSSSSAATADAPAASQAAKVADATKGPDAVLALTLGRYTDVRPIWR